MSALCRGTLVTRYRGQTRTRNPAQVVPISCGRVRVGDVPPSAAVEVLAPRGLSRSSPDAGSRATAARSRGIRAQTLMARRTLTSSSSRAQRRVTRASSNRCVVRTARARADLTADVASLACGEDGEKHNAPTAESALRAHIASIAQNEAAVLAQVVDLQHRTVRVPPHPRHDVLSAEAALHPGTVGEWSERGDVHEALARRDGVCAEPVVEVDHRHAVGERAPGTQRRFDGRIVGPVVEGQHLDAPAREPVERPAASEHGLRHAAEVIGNRPGHCEMATRRHPYGTVTHGRPPSTSQSTPPRPARRRSPRNHAMRVMPRRGAAQ